ncbi:hypothetical protein AB0M12_07790 [Nocardia vinacea]|uniref:hypothetical protein n=1 Tax=Nocardia vinacea TaxID=96468 RepID=UPI00344262C0
MATIAGVDPGCPYCPSGLRPDLRRSDFGAGLSNGLSQGGGFDEFIPSRRFDSAFSARNSAFSASNEPSFEPLDHPGLPRHQRDKFLMRDRTRIGWHPTSFTVQCR